MTKKTIIASLGGGFTSSALMPRVLLEQHDKDQIHFINCVLPNEHPDMWRLFDAVEENLGIEITYIAYHPETKWQYVTKKDRGNKDLLYTPFDIFFQQGFIGNSRNDPCSRLLKRETIYHYVSEMYDPDNTEIAVGIHFYELERSVAIRENWKRQGWKVIFPIIDEEEKFEREDEIRLMREWYGVSLELYEKNFEHNNCAGACVKAGQRQWAQLWYHYPEVYMEWEGLERKWNEQFYDKYKKEYTILRIQRNGKRIYISLKDFRETILEPAATGEKDGFLARMIADLPGNPACMWCAAI